MSIARKPFRLFNLDLHVSVIQDVKHVLRHLYGSAVEVTNWSISGHNWVFGAATPTVDVVHADSWREINPGMVAAFQSRYGDFMRSFDGFVVTHAPVFCMLYETFGKPIVLVNSCRYEQPFCWSGDVAGWEWLNAGLKRMHDRGQLLAISNNRADQDYLFAGTGVASLHIPSLGLYTGATYAPTRMQCVCFGDRAFFPPSDRLIEKPRRGYAWKDLYSYKGIVHIPYEMSTMSLCEQYSAGVPLWLPSRRFYKECIERRAMPFASVYAKVCPAAVESRLRSLDFWLERADYYDSVYFPGIHFYDSPEDCVRQIACFRESTAAQAERSAWLATRCRNIYRKWEDVLGEPGSDFLRPRPIAASDASAALPAKSPAAPCGNVLMSGRGRLP